MAVAFKVNAGGRTGDCKVTCLNTTGVPILLSVQGWSKLVTIIDFSSGAAFFRNLRDQSFVQLERETHGFMCHWWKICQQQGSKQRHTLWKISTNRDSTLRRHCRPEGPMN